MFLFVWFVSGFLEIEKHIIIFHVFLYLCFKNAQEVYMVITALTPARFRTLDIVVFSGGAHVLVIPVTFHLLYVLRQQVLGNEA